MDPDLDAASDSEGWNSELDDVPLVYDDESCSEASGGCSARSLNSSDTGALSSRGQHSTGQHRLSRESSATSGSTAFLMQDATGTSSFSKIPSRSNSSKSQAPSLRLSELNGSQQPTPQQAQLQEEASQQQPAAASTKIPKPPQMQLQLPPSAANRSNSIEAAPAAVGRGTKGLKLPLPGQQISSSQTACTEQHAVAAGAAAAGRGKPPPLALLSNNSSSPASSPQVSSRTAPGNQNSSSSSSTYAGLGALRAFAAKSDSSEAYQQQQLVRVQLLLPAVEVYLPLQQPPAEAASKSSSSSSRPSAPDANTTTIKRSSSKLSRVSNSSSSGSASTAAAADDAQQQQQHSNKATADSLQLALSKAFGVDAKHLAFFNVQQFEALEDLLQLQQPQRNILSKQTNKPSVGQPVAKPAADSTTTSSSSSSEIQFAVGFGAGCSFSLQEIDNIVQTAGLVAQEAEALRAEKTQLQNELTITRLHAAEHSADLGRLTAQHNTLTQELENTRSALLTEQQRTADLQQRVAEAGAEFKRLKLAYEALKTGSSGTTGSSSSKTVRRQPRSGGESLPSKATAAAAVVPALPIAAAQQCSVNARPQQQRCGKEALAALLEKPEYASTLTKLLQPGVMEKLTMITTAVERMPQYYAAAESLVPPSVVAAAAAVPLPEQVAAAAALTPRGSGSCTPRNPAALYAAAAAAAATTGAEMRGGSSTGGSGGSTARGRPGSSKSTPRISSTGDAAAGSSCGVVTAAAYQQQPQGTPGGEVVTPRTAVGLL